MPGVSMKINALFAAPLGDEVELERRARALIAGYACPLSPADVQDICVQHGLEIATRAWYESLLLSHHGEFKSCIDAFDIDALQRLDPNTRQRYRLLIVPGMFYREHPEVGADGRLIADIAARVGVEYEIIDIASRGSIRDNSKRISAALERSAGRNTWLVSMSKGSSEVLHYLQSGNPCSQLKGWLNIAGIAAGSPHADRKLSSPLRRLFYRLLCAVLGVDYQVMQELNTDNPMWSNPVDAAQLECIHVAPIPLRAHLTAKLQPRYRKLAALGPNDGIVPVTDVMRLPGLVYPLWGVDHFMRAPGIAELIYRFLCYILVDRHSTQRRETL